MKRRILFFILIVICTYTLSSFDFSYTENKTYTFVERTDLRRYDNGKYIGLMSREVKAVITPENDIYDGNFYVNQDTRRSVSYVTSGIHDSIPSVFKISENGQFSMIEDYGYPSFRSFPTFPKSEIHPGESWEAEAERAVDPLNKGLFTRIPVYAQYTYLRDEVYHGEEVYLLSAKWATRYGTGTKILDLDGDKSLVSAAGNHSATIYISKKTGNALVVRDSVDEQFTYSGGNKIAFKGTISLFTEYPPQINDEEILPIINEVSDVEVEKTNAGLRLRLTNLQFKPNSAELLEGEKIRLLQIAAALKKVPESQFLVEGHTASTGNPKGEKELSLERAHTIVKELAALGIPVERFICKGSGGTKPIADNSTSEGKAINRRVEITILE